MKSFFSLAAPFALFAAVLPGSAQTPDKTKDKAKEYKIVWKKTALDTKFRSEGAAAADVNGDGKKDILVGELWYEAPKWTPHKIRSDKTFDPKNYSESFAVFTEDLDKDGLIDQILVGFPGKECHWFKNPGKDGGPWKSFVIQDNACNETPIYVDLLGVGKKGLILGHKGEMAFFLPASDPTKPWTKIPISGPGKIPGTDKFSHGLGAGDVNGDGKLDIMVTAGWWEQPLSNATLGGWKFHPLSVIDGGKNRNGVPECADMYAFDIDGDGKNDILSSAAHGAGIWWHQQKPGKDHPSFATNLMFPLPGALAKAPEGFKFTKEEADLYAAINKARFDQKKAPWRTNLKLCQDARANAAAAASAEKKFTVERAKYEGDIVGTDYGVFLKAADHAREFLDDFPKLKHPGLEIGIGIYEGAGKKHFLILVGERNQFAVPGQTHALQFVDIDGDGQKDLVTGRRYWAHGPNGDDSPADPAFLYWFKAKKDKSGFTTFDPQLIDDDSGIGTQFAVEDVDGDGLMDIIVANKRGVFLFLQSREAVINPVPPPVDDE
jgi:hypothetical protein